MSSIITPLLHTFSTALTTNALLHLLSKASFTLTTFALYATLSPQDFSIWATTQSIVFLTVLWLDFGLRKSIPRYAPALRTQRHRLLLTLLTAQLFIFIIAIPILLYFLSPLTTNSSILLLAIGLYITESLTNILRSLYHAFFYHRFFNHYAALGTLTDTVITLTLVLLLPSHYLVPAIFLTKCLTTTTVAIIALAYWHQQPSPYGTQESSFQEPSFATIQPQFIKHSFFMWCTTILTSISERNFLLPYIMSVTDMHTGTMFKLANDGALLFYRFIIKTIGSADTALLAHVHTHHANAYHVDGSLSLMQQSLQKITTQIARLACPLLGVIFCTIPIGYWFYNNQFVFHAFLIMAIGYVIETICIPYERMLEVKENYKVLSYIYMVYIISIASLFFLLYMTWIGCTLFLIGIHGVRLVIGLLMRYGVYHEYGL